MRTKKKESCACIDVALGDGVRTEGSGVPLPLSAPCYHPAEMEGRGRTLQRGAARDTTRFPVVPPRTRVSARSVTLRWVASVRS